MGGDDLGSDDECLYASESDTSSQHGDRQQDESDLDKAVAIPTNTSSNKRKSTEIRDDAIKTKKTKNKAKTNVVLAVTEQSVQQQATFLSSAVAKFVSTLDQRPKGTELTPAHIASSKKDSLLDRLTDIVAQNKIRKWKDKVSPCVVVVCVSARRAVQVLKELAPIKARAAKLFPKNGSISEQLKELAETPFGLAVGTPHRIQALCKGEGSTSLTLKRSQLIVFDCHMNDKQYSVLTLPDTASSCMGLLVEYIIPELHQRKEFRVALV